MKTLNITAIFLISVVFASCTSEAKVIPTKTAISMAENFSFVFTDYSCSSTPSDIFDSATGVLIHTPLGKTESITLPFQLTKDEMQEVFQKLAAMDFFNFPSDFTIPDEYMVATSVPIASYELSAKNGKLVNKISWTTGGFEDSGYAKADQLQELITFIQTIIYTDPRYEQLPEGEYYCQ